MFVPASPAGADSAKTDSDRNATDVSFEPPVVIENMPFTDRLYAISEDPLQSISVAVMVIE